ncbi:hypothetical protein [Escherichia coli]|uniref:hypothetical protein n=1 Tax=Escherichia coli TaxID=562 RepID=UPI00203763D3|nr:hypothetical protein [Escherichia coli]
MTENTEPSSPSHPAPDPEILKSTIRAMKQSEQRANNVPALIKALLCTGTCLLISILVTPFSTGTQRMWSANIRYRQWSSGQAGTNKSASMESE